jgi:hypothetical protein
MWFVYGEDGARRGPLDVDAVIEVVLSGEVSRGAPAAEVVEEGRVLEWRPLISIPELAARLPAQSRPPALAVAPGGFTTRHSGDPDFGATMMIIDGKDPKP